ncbi:MAG TPA: CvpA family protein [Chitinivibrionales bacterium]
MHAFDIVFYIFSAIFIIIGIRRGFIEEVVRLLALVSGFVCGLVLYKPLMPKLSFLSLAPHVTAVIAFLGIFLGCTILLLLIGKLIKKIVSLAMLGWLDRLGGGLVGALKAIVLGWIFVTAATSLPICDTAKMFRGSPVFSFFVTLSPALKAEVLRRAQLPGRHAAQLPGGIMSKLKSLGTAKYSTGRKEPVKKKHPLDSKNVL